MEKYRSSSNRIIGNNRLNVQRLKVTKKRTKDKILVKEEKTKDRGKEKCDLKISSFKFESFSKMDMENEFYEKELFDKEKSRKIEELEIETSMNAKKINRLSTFMNRYATLIKELNHDLMDLHGNLSETIHMKNSQKINRRRNLNKKKKSMRMSSNDVLLLTKKIFTNKSDMTKKVQKLFTKKKQIEMKKRELAEMEKTVEFKESEFNINNDLELKEKVIELKCLNETKIELMSKKALKMKMLEYEFFKLRNKPIVFIFLSLFQNQNPFELEKKFIIKKNFIEINPILSKNNSTLKSSTKLNFDYIFYRNDSKKSKLLKKSGKDIIIFLLDYLVLNFRDKMNLLYVDVMNGNVKAPFAYSLAISKQIMNFIFIYFNDHFCNRMIVIIFENIKKIIWNSDIFKTFTENNELIFKIKLNNSNEIINLDDLFVLIKKSNLVQLVLEFSVPNLVTEVVHRVNINLNFRNEKNEIVNGNTNSWRTIYIIEDEMWVKKEGEEERVATSQRRFESLKELLNN